MSGRVILMGSGELAPGLVATHRAGLEAAETDRVVILDTPYGFQENADQLTERIATFFETSLRAEVEVATLRHEKGDAVTKERFLAALRSARYVFSGPGSPSYALRVWSDIGVRDVLGSVVNGGGTVTFASAASLTLGRTTLPVYEIYKVGEAPRWLPGLDLTTALGFPCTVVPHWNNAEGGNHDTSRCYVGERRFGELVRGLDVGVLGVDEHTAVTLDFANSRLAVTGVGTVTLRGAEETVLRSGETTTLTSARTALGEGDVADDSPIPQQRPQVDLDAAIRGRDGDAVLAALLEAEEASQGSPEARDEFRTSLVKIVDVAGAGLTDPRQNLAGFVGLLLRIRADARSNGDYATADMIRDNLADLGVEVRDTTAGAEWELRNR
ncbi:MAG: hypothetical protein QNJ81_02025 [Acidimicrobiia bacterium]|nr:hypothetical protein [Acidimicrobiia bacterium]